MTFVLVRVRSEYDYVAWLNRSELNTAYPVCCSIKEPVGVEYFHYLNQCPFDVD